MILVQFISIKLKLYVFFYFFLFYLTLMKNLQEWKKNSKKNVFRPMAQ